MFIKNALLSIALVLSTSISHADEAATQPEKSMPRKIKALGPIFTGTLGAGVSALYLRNLEDYKKTKKGLALVSAERKIKMAKGLILSDVMDEKIAELEAEIKQETNARTVLSLEEELASWKKYPSYSGGEKQACIEKYIADFNKAKLMGNEASMRVIAARAFFVLSLIDLGYGAYMMSSSEE